MRPCRCRPVAWRSYSHSHSGRARPDHPPRCLGGEERNRKQTRSSQTAKGARHVRTSRSRTDPSHHTQRRPPRVRVPRTGTTWCRSVELSIAEEPTCDVRSSHQFSSTRHQIDRGWWRFAIEIARRRWLARLSFLPNAPPAKATRRALASPAPFSLP